ncbi:Nif3-like dinuclear metal center hexameric protein [Mammaliicoccus sciuri]|uniref:Nif3-like dinuclear metal center hexameric protein n=1 Tax=Mammaliicoccus sciuri TaxID=1296 RepID=UPI003364C256
MIIQELLQEIDKQVPFSTSESWDNVGLLIGSEKSEVNGVLTTLDCTLEVVEEAIQNNINTIIAHHPLIFKGVKNITDKSYGPIIRKLIQHDINLIALHTNLDVHPKGVSYMIGQQIGLDNMKVLEEQQESYYKVQIFLPDKDVEAMKAAFNDHHLAQTEEYSEVFFQSQGKGQFKPSASANPHLGQADKTETVYETKLELMVDEKDLTLAKELIIQTHPYEEPVYDFIKMSRTSSVGLGIIGELNETQSVNEFVQNYKQKLAIPAVRFIGDQSTQIKRVAIVGGAGIEYANLAKAQQADLFITGDVKHHEALDALMDGINVLDVNHYSEYVMKDGLKTLLEKWTNGTIKVLTSSINTDPYQYM